MRIKWFFLCLSLIMLNCKEKNVTLYVGTYTNGESEGIYQFQFNTETGELNNKLLAAKTDNPSFISYSPNKQFMYAVGEGSTGTVASFKVNKNGTLQLLNKVNSNGSAPCHISINPKGNKAVVSNYMSGNVSLYNINNDGTLNNAYQIFDYSSTGRVSHAHSAQFFKDKLYVSDLGINSVYEYKLNNNKANYELISSSIVNLKEKAGPRHFSISKDGQFLYIINEYASTISAVKKVKDKYKLVNNYSTLSESFNGTNSCADVHLSQDEKYLYGSNRGENTIVVFNRNKNDGSLRKIQTISTEGDWPRNFNIDPTGKFLLVANQKSNNISVYNIDSASGELSFLHSSNIPTPVCLEF